MKKKTFKLDSDNSKIIIIVLLAINLLLALYISFFKKDALWLEILKSGWRENFTLIEKLYNNENFKDQQAQTLAQVLGSMEGETTSETETTNAKVLDQTTMDSILKDTYVKWNENARFVIFEYSDFLCPFCQRHHNDRTLQKVQEKYPNDVALIFKNMPLVQLHPTAPLGAEAAECAGKIGGSEAFYNYVDKAFTQSNFDNDNTLALAKEVGLNSSRFTTCIKNNEFKSKVDWIIEEASKIFGIGWTPGNVILDKETGKYIVVNWAYPFEKFDEEVQNLMNQ